MNKEIRQVPESKIETRTTESGEKILSGIVVPWDSLSVPLFGFKEKFKRGAFTETLQKRTVKALMNHNSDLLLGSSKSGTLTLRETDIGLEYELRLPNTTVANDLYEVVARGDLDGTSFGFFVPPNGDSWEETEERQVVRTVEKCELVEISPTPFPAYIGSNTQVRSIDQAYQHHIDTSQKDDDFINKTKEQSQRTLFILQQKLNLKERI